MIGYIGIYVDGIQKYNWRFFRDKKFLPKIGEEITFDGDTWDIRYLVKKIKRRERIKGYPDSYEFDCEDLSKEKYGPFRRQTFIGSFHEMDKALMKMYPKYREKDYEVCK